MDTACEQSCEPPRGAGFLHGGYAQDRTSIFNTITNTSHCGDRLIRASPSTSKPRAPGNVSTCGVPGLWEPQKQVCAVGPGWAGGSHLSQLGVGRARFTSVRSRTRSEEDPPLCQDRAQGTVTSWNPPLSCSRGQSCASRCPVPHPCRGHTAPLTVSKGPRSKVF